MIADNQLVLVLMTLLLTVHSGSCTHGDAQVNCVSKVFCVTSNISNYGGHPCHGYNSTEYHTLDYYMVHNSSYFKSYHTYVFDYGHHTPRDKFTLEIRKVRYLSFVGVTLDKTKAVIDCDGRATSFKFNGVSNLFFENITLTSCLPQKHASGRLRTIGLAVLSFIDGANLFLSGVAILHSADEAFLIYDVTGDIVIKDSDIADSHTVGRPVKQSGNGITYRKCYSNDETNITISNSRFLNNSNYFKPKRYFKPMNAGGLSINIKCPNVKLRLINITMSHNTGNVGGNLDISFQIYSNVSVEIINSTFKGGNALKGGGMFVAFIGKPHKDDVCKSGISWNRLLHVYNSSFTNNLATRYGGGGVFVKNMQYLPKLECNEIQYIVFENVTFNNNSVVDTDYGGGVAFHSINFLITGYVFHVNPVFQIFLEH